MRIETPNLDDVQTGMEPIPAGRYTVLVTKGELKTAKDGQSKYIGWEGKVQGGDHNDRSVFWNTSLKTNALWNLKAFLEAAGASWDKGGFNTEDVLGRKLDVEVGVRTYEGKDSNEVKNYFTATA